MERDDWNSIFCRSPLIKFEKDDGSTPTIESVYSVSGDNYLDSAIKMEPDSNSDNESNHSSTDPEFKPKTSNSTDEEEEPEAISRRLRKKRSPPPKPSKTTPKAKKKKTEAKDVQPPVPPKSEKELLIEKYFLKEFEDLDDDGLFWCRTCNKSFPKIINLRMHRYTHRDKNSALCEICGKGFKTNNRRNRHIQTYHSNNIKCDACNDSFSSKRDFKYHNCPSKDNQRSDPEPRMAYNLQDFPFQCQFCGKGFKTKQPLTFHLQRHDPNRKREYQCGLCEKKFFREFDLNQHQQFHSQDKQFGCDTCGKYFKTKVLLNQHMTVHIGLEQFKCKFCDRKFKRKYEVQQHERSHTGDRPFSCGVCGKSFTALSNLSIHKKIHESEKRFSCKVCGKGFHVKCNLETHMKVHKK